MATVAAPRRRARVGRRWWIAIGVVAVLAVVGALAMGALGGGARQAAGTPGWTTATATTGAIEASVSATGSVESQSQAELRFLADGNVTEILVRPGDRVKAGQPLARVDATDAQLKLAAAQADVDQAQAALDKLTAGATPEELKDAQAKLAQAQAAYQQTLAKVSNADIAAARARVQQAELRLAQLRGGNESADMRDAQASLERARLAVQSERDRLSQAKTNADLAMQSATADLARAQQSYATAKQNWDFVNETGQDPTNPEYRDAAGKTVKVKLSDTQRQQYYDAFISAESALRSAEASVAQARVSYDAARQAEVTGVQTAEQQLASAQAAYDKARSGEPANLADARATLASAQADLNRLIGESRSSDLASAQASLDAAQVALEKITSGASKYDLLRAQSDVARSATALKQAQRALDLTTLTAPFDGTVARVDLHVGQAPGASGAVVLVDTQRLHVDVPVDELDVPQVAIGQAAHISLDALPDTDLSGKVTTIAPLATKSDKGTNTYAATVELEGSNPAVRPGMTAAVEVVTTRKEGVVLVPRRAIQTDNGESYVLVPAAAGQTTPQPATPGSAPQPGRRQPVTLGLSNSEMIEVTSGLKAGETVYVPDVVQTFNPLAQ